MTLAEHLQKTGVILSQDVGFIVEDRDKYGKLRAQFARTARVCTSIPSGLGHHVEVQEYDPEYDLALLWNKGAEPILCILCMTDGAILYEVSAGGLIIDNNRSRISVGQNDTFIQTVCEIQCALTAPIH